MERVGMVSLLAVCSIFILISLDCAYANSEGDALYAFRSNLDSYTDVFESWDPSSSDPCTWFHVTCNAADSVTSVDLGNAALSGKLYLNLTELPNLETLNLYENFLYGDLTNLTLSPNLKLKSLYLYMNALEGPIPPELLNLPLLEHLDLSNCNFDGNLPDYWWDQNKQPNLIIIELANNSLSGSVPASWDTVIHNIHLVDLTHNYARTNTGVSYLTGNCTTEPCYGV